MLCKVPATIPPTTKRTVSAPSHIKRLGPLMKLKGNLRAADHSLTLLQSCTFSVFFFPFKSWPAVFINDVNTETTGTSHADQTQTLRKLAQLSYCRPSRTSSTSQLCLPSGEKRGDSWAAFSSPHPQARSSKHSIQELCMVLLWQKANTVCFANWALCVVERNESSPARAFHIF